MVFLKTNSNQTLALCTLRAVCLASGRKARAATILTGMNPCEQQLQDLGEAEGCGAIQCDCLVCVGLELGLSRRVRV